MPTYVTDSSLVTEIRAIQTRLSKLEQTARTGAEQTSTEGITGEGYSGGDLTLSEADARYLRVSGGTVLGAVQFSSLMDATTAHFTGNVTIDGTLTATGAGFAQDDEIVHLAGAETITGSKTFVAEQYFSGDGSYSVDPDPGATRAIKIADSGMALVGGLDADTITADSMTVTGAGVTTTALTVSTMITATGGIDFGTSAVLDLSKANGVDIGAVGTGLGDKIALYTDLYGMGIQPFRFVAYVPDSAAFAVRATNTAAGQQSAGVDAHLLHGNGNATHAGSLTVGTGLTVSGGTVTLPAGAVGASSLANDSVTGTGTGPQGSGYGKIASQTIGEYNIANEAITTRHLHPALVVVDDQIDGVSATKFLPGTITTDGIFLGAGGHIYAGPTMLPVGLNQARVDFNSGGIQAYDGTSQVFNLSASGSFVTKASITSGSTITGATVTGVDGLIAGSGNSVFKAGSNGIQLGHATFGSAPFRVDMTGALTATAATITGTITSSTVTGTTLNATNSINAAAINSGIIDTNRLAVDVITTQQVALNPEFDLGATTVATNWVYNWIVNGAVTTQREADTEAGVGQYKVTVSPAASAGGSVASDAIPVVPGESYRLSTTVKSTSQLGTVYLRATFGASSTFTSTQLIAATPVKLWSSSTTGGSGPGYADFHNGPLAALNTWYTLSGDVLVPAGATHMRVVVIGWLHANAWSLHVRNVTATQRVGGTEIANGIITTDSVVAAGISASAISTGTLRAGSYIVTGSISAGQAHTILDARSGTRGIRLFNGTTTTFNADLETGNVSVTGAINATSGTFSGNITSTATISGGTISGGTITGGAISGGTISGTTITGGSISSGTTITGVTITGGTVQTATSGTRAVIDTNTSHQIRLFGGSNSYPGYIVGYNSPTGYSGVMIGDGKTQSSTAGGVLATFGNGYIDLVAPEMYFQGMLWNYDSTNARSQGLSVSAGILFGTNHSSSSTSHLIMQVQSPNAGFYIRTSEPDSGTSNVQPFFGQSGWDTGVKYLYADGTFLGSDQSTKRNIEVVDQRLLPKMRSLVVKSFNREDNEHRREVGLMAQELQALAPELVVTNRHKDNSLAIDQAGLLMYVLKAVQELATEVDSLRPGPPATPTPPVPSTPAPPTP